MENKQYFIVVNGEKKQSYSVRNQPEVFETLQQIQDENGTLPPLVVYEAVPILDLSKPTNRKES